uniref:Uncharacterized protein n=1 Tax=Romanomermis culicivorax TaxID=13658 RepID=A0A915KY67_ROMCU
MLQPPYQQQFKQSRESHFHNNNGWNHQQTPHFSPQNSSQTYQGSSNQQGVFALDINQMSKMEELTAEIKKERETSKQLVTQCAALQRQVDRMVL